MRRQTHHTINSQCIRLKGRGPTPDIVRVGNGSLTRSRSTDSAERTSWESSKGGEDTPRRRRRDKQSEPGELYVEVVVVWKPVPVPGP